MCQGMPMNCQSGAAGMPGSGEDGDDAGQIKEVRRSVAILETRGSVISSLCFAWVHDWKHEDHTNRRHYFVQHDTKKQL